MVEIIAAAIEAELGKQEMVMTDPMTLRRLMACRVARTALLAIRDNVTPGMVEAGLTTGSRFGKAAMKNIFRTMIDQALVEGGE